MPVRRSHGLTVRDAYCHRVRNFSALATKYARDRIGPVPTTGPRRGRRAGRDQFLRGWSSYFRSERPCLLLRQDHVLFHCVVRTAAFVPSDIT